MANKWVNTIEKSNIRYRMIYALARFFFVRFYRKIHVRGQEKIPYGHPIIFAPNHQNALMDALAVVFGQKNDVIFLARADIFKKPKVASFLNFIKILPAYRQRDGVENLAKNEDVFKILVRTLVAKSSTCIMAEAGHNNKYQLQPLAKGMFRIAFQTQENIKDDKGVMIVPVGLHFEDYIKSNHQLGITYHEPISIAEYAQKFDGKPAHALNAVKKQLETSLKDVMLQIESKKYYEGINIIRDLFFSLKKNFFENYDKQRSLVKKLDQLEKDEILYFPQLMFFAEEYKSTLTALNTRHWIVKRNKVGALELVGDIILLLLTLPFFLFGFIHNIVPFQIPVWKSKNVEDTQFKSSFRYVMGTISFVTFYIIMFVIAGIALGFKWAPIYLLLAYVLGKFALVWHRLFKRFRGKTRWIQLKKSKHPKLLYAQELLNKITLLTNDLIKDEVTQ